METIILFLCIPSAHVGLEDWPAGNSGKQHSGTMDMVSRFTALHVLFLPAGLSLQYLFRRNCAYPDDDPRTKKLTVGEVNGKLDELATAEDRKEQVGRGIPGGAGEGDAGMREEEG